MIHDVMFILALISVPTPSSVRSYLFTSLQSFFFVPDDERLATLEYRYAIFNIFTRL